ncbi:MAG: class I SAM-dependent methyltransferase [Anaerolineae bacterium]|jgi:hypothetical protein|nr:class I SAM-dependent methyltransferase [Anaerolineae bacterium]
MRRPRPQGQPTRGKTAVHRLRLVDLWLLLARPEVLTAGAPLVVDVGYGAQPWTALEMLARWQTLNPALRLVGVEIDAERVAAAQPYAQPGTSAFVQGGFNLVDVLAGQQARVIRAYNVLRQYDESAVPAALARMAQALEPGGLLIEGTCNPAGSLAVFDVYRRHEDRLHHQALVFAGTLRQPVEPVDFQAVLPKRLIHRTQAAAPAAFLAAWGRALQLARGAGHQAPRPRWQAAAQHLRQAGLPVDGRRRIIRRGFLPLYDSLLPADVGVAQPGW